MNFWQEAELMQAMSALESYRRMPEYRTAKRAITKLAKAGGDVEAAALRAAWWFSVEEGSRGYMWADKQKQKGRKPEYADYRKGH